VAAPEDGPRRAPASRGPARQRREIAVAYLLLAPAVVLVFGVLAYPLGWSV